ncbi:hypothetical protein RQP53_14045 [Paucibacter sp. APW11]|uniref:DUF2059 domain-containing protein n=1 Tax=Roseateles aquae TaxID=3077235 RepID=A0ABU3PCU3_9BURK|nr:hypothetical protein [Paucibacter sp. APW11]MDT9000392.1 hypothetical protein [Paucibacter sp. APW11]
MSNRRNFLSGAVSLAVFGPALAANDDCKGGKREALLTPGTGTLQQASIAPGARYHWEYPAAIAGSFQDTIESNLKRMPAADLQRLLASMNAAELNDLAYYYGNATSNSSKPAALLDIVAAKCDTPTLARIGEHFGFADTYAAAARLSPTAATELSLLLSPMAERALTQSRPANRGLIALGSTPAPNIDFTIKQIYLDYRTAPVGSLSVRAALYETASFVGSRLTTSFAAGYAVGTAINNLWSTYAPESYNAFSDKLGQSVDFFMNSATSILNGSAFDSLSFSSRLQLGGYQRQFFFSGAFGSLGSSSSFYSGGGDFGVSGPWKDREERDSCK